jgi:hypothetical protein
VRPAVIVRDASGGAVSGVAVTFTVDSGGGSLSATSATTGSDGIATAGAWTLGPVAGRNTIKVTAASLTPVIIAATAGAGSGTVAPITVGTGGGVSRVTDSGPLKGMELIVPGGAITAPLQATVSYTPATGFPAIAGTTVISPLITVATTATTDVAAPIAIHVPATVPPNTFPVTVAFDPATGARAVVSTLSWDANGVTTMFASIASTTLLGSTEANGSLRAGLRGSSSLHLVVIAVSDSAVMADYDTGFRPGVDDWEFPFATTAADTIPISVGLPLTALWYYTTKPSAASLNRRFQLAAGVPFSDAAGLRWTSEISKQNGTTYARGALSTLMLAAMGADTTGADWNQFLSVRAAFALAQGAVPAPQFIFVSQSIGSSAGLAYPPLIVYRATGNNLYIADADAPGDVNRYLTFNHTLGMTPYAIVGSSSSNPVSGMHPVTFALATQVQPSLLSSTYAQALAGTIGGDDFPAYQFRTQFGPVVNDTVWLGDSVRVWAECNSCTPLISSPSAPEATASLAGLRIYYFQESPAQWNLQATSKVIGLAFPPAAIGKHLTAGMEVDWLESPDTVSNTRWIDWHQLIAIHLGDSIVAAVGTLSTDSIMTSFSQLVSGPAPRPLTYVWQFGDGSHPDTVAGASTATHGYAQPGTYPVTVQGFDPATKQVIIHSTTLRDSVARPHFAWQMNSFDKSFHEPSDIGPNQSDTVVFNKIHDVFNAMQDAPASNAVIVVGDSLGCAVIIVEHFGAGQAVQPVPVAGAGNALLGVGEQCDGQVIGTVSMSPLGTGSLVGSLLFSSDSFSGSSVKLGNASISATMSGTTLTGTFTWRAEYDGGEGTYTGTFSATQIAPSPATPPSGRRVKGKATKS